MLKKIFFALMLMVSSQTFALSDQRQDQISEVVSFGNILNCEQRDLAGKVYANIHMLLMYSDIEINRRQEIMSSLYEKTANYINGKDRQYVEFRNYVREIGMTCDSARQTLLSFLDVLKMDVLELANISDYEYNGVVNQIVFELDDVKPTEDIFYEYSDSVIKRHVISDFRYM